MPGPGREVCPHRIDVDDAAGEVHQRRGRRDDGEQPRRGRETVPPLVGRTTASIAAARARARRLLITHPLCSIAGSARLRRPPCEPLPRRPGEPDELGSVCARRKILDEPADRSPISTPDRSKQTASPPDRTNAAVADRPTTPPPTTPTFIAARVAPRESLSRTSEP